MHWSMSLVVIYFGTRRKYPGQAHNTVLFGPRYREMLAEIFHGPALPPDFSLYLHQPTVTDPGLAPPGGETFYVLAPVPHMGVASVDWPTVAEPYADRILAALETVLPILRQVIVTRRIFTPVDFRDQLQAFQCSAFSVAPRLSQSAYFRPHNRDPEIPGLYIVGAGTHPGAGVPGVINSAKATVRVVMDDLGHRAEALASCRRGRPRGPGGRWRGGSWRATRRASRWPASCFPRRCARTRRRCTPGAGGATMRSTRRPHHPIARWRCGGCGPSSPPCPPARGA